MVKARVGPDEFEDRSAQLLRILRQRKLAHEIAGFRQREIHSYNFSQTSSIAAPS
ncbi:MAG TPA: hypothetical protein VHS81_08445 [Caulobacteraceae bacterium]|nr:hypothetical protein [Caulobacteraceae bacterium]